METLLNFDTDHTRRNFLCNLEVAKEEDFRAAARRLTDIAVWSNIIEITNLEAVMDKEEKDNLRRELHDNPPEITVDNIYGTLQAFVQNADLIWRRGIANCFSNLDRRFRSHDGWKIGSRVILDHAFNEYGGWNFYRAHKDTLIDIERAFFMLDGRKPPLQYNGLVAAIEQDRRKGRGYGARQSQILSEFFMCRIYKNGNCHLWFRRDDLVEKVNLLLAEYYGEALANDLDEGDESELKNPKTSLAKNYGHFPTPELVAYDVIEMARLYKNVNPPLQVLEPSAGEGNIARLAAKEGVIVDCIEIQPHLAKILEASGQYRRVMQGDFLAHPPKPIYDRVVMNPPFDRERDIDHVMHAMKFLKDDGILVAVMSAGTEWRETKKSRAFRDYMNGLNASWRDLPMGAFSEVGTNVNTIVLSANKDGRKSWR